jgi:hypothetical protein
MGEFYGPLLHTAYSIASAWLISYSIISKTVIAIVSAVVAIVFLEYLFPETTRERPTVSVMIRRAFRVLAGVTIGPILIVGVMFIVSLVYYAPTALMQNTVTTDVQKATQQQSTTDQQQCQSTLKVQETSCNQRLDAQKKAQVDTLEKAFLEQKKHLRKLTSTELNGSLRYTQEAIPSIDADFPYGLKVVLQTTKTLPVPITIMVGCNGEIGKGTGSLSGVAMYTGGSGLGIRNPHIFGISVQSPQIEPEDTVVFRLYSKAPLQAIGIKAQ